MLIASNLVLLSSCEQHNEGSRCGWRDQSAYFHGVIKSIFPPAPPTRQARGVLMFLKMFEILKFWFHFKTLQHEPLPMVEFCSCDKMTKVGTPSRKWFYFDWNLTEKCNQSLCLL